ncbi:transcriptional regulator [Bizionia arctica]|uniref:Tetratricopeptide repeat protein n=1 Tax=Bizionia arctica TaxID=1495645 RepID=A0A917LP33_9FLAO|nr:tetratricopeptide repeat protein [Bizionia arctica]GGG48026.1 hypothetical protein GCM10010976_19250 [Bizionia arctica]
MCFRHLLLGTYFLITCYCHAQESKNSKQALKQFDSLTVVMEQSFPEDDFKSYRRESFSEQQLQAYLSQHFQRLDLLPSIEGHHGFKLNNYLQSGNWFRQLGFPKESIKWYKVFFDYYNKHTPDLTQFEKDSLVPMQAYSYSELAENYANLGYLDSASLEHKKNIKFAKELNTISTPSAYNNYGLFFYWFKKDLDSALVYFNKAYVVTHRDYPNHTLIGSIRDNLADIYRDKNQPDKALPLYQTNFNFYQNFKNEKSQELDIPRLISAGSQLVETEIVLNKLDDAELTFSKLTHLTSIFSKLLLPSSKLEFLKAQEILLVAQQDYKKAYAIGEKRRILNDSLNSILKTADKKWQEELNTISLDRVALNFKIDRINKENEIQKQRSKLLIVSLSSSFVLILLLLLFLSRRQHLKNAKNKQLLAEQSRDLISFKNRELESEIESKKRDLSDFAINLTQNQEWAETLADKLKVIKQSEIKNREHLIDELEQDIRNKITVDSDTKDFYERLDKLSDSFYSELINLFPDLSKNEIRLCSLIRLKMDSRSIATLQNIALSSLNTSRYRLRKKLKLSEVENLDDFIQHL